MKKTTQVMNVQRSRKAITARIFTVLDVSYTTEDAINCFIELLVLCHFIFLTYRHKYNSS